MPTREEYFITREFAPSEYEFIRAVLSNRMLALERDATEYEEKGRPTLASTASEDAKKIRLTLDYHFPPRVQTVADLEKAGE